jgi:hypothetical protein
MLLFTSVSQYSASVGDVYKIEKRLANEWFLL